MGKGVSGGDALHHAAPLIPTKLKEKDIIPAIENYYQQQRIMV